MTQHEALNVLIKSLGDTNPISDGYHTFEELYDHRITLYVALCKQLSKERHDIWRTAIHSDNSVWDGWFLLGIGYNAGEQITYHLPVSRWEECDFAIQIHKAPTFDGHSSAQVIQRIKNL